MAVSQTTTGGAPYTWAGATWDWDEIRSAKTWDTSGGSAFYCDEADAVPVFAEARRVDFLDRLSESLATAEARRSRVDDLAREFLSTAESRADVWTVARVLAEAIATAEVPSRSIVAVDSEAIATAEFRSDVWIVARTLAEAWSTAETYVDFANWIQANLEALSASSALASGLSRASLYEALGVVEASRVSEIDALDAETLATAERRLGAIGAVDSEALATSESLADVWTVVRTPAETWSTVEARRTTGAFVESETLSVVDVASDAVYFVRLVAESLSTAEDRADVVAYARTLAELLRTAELRATAATSVEPETLATTDAYADVYAARRVWAESLPILAEGPTLVVKGLAESLSLDESRADYWTAFLTVARSLGLSESYIDNIAWIQANATALGFAVVRAKDAASVKRETIATVDRLYKAISNVETQTLALSETYVDLINFLQSNLESFGLAETSPTAIAKRILRTLATRDMNLRNATGVYGDLSVRSTALTADAFAALVAVRHPEGYDDFKEFLSGDYQFQRALVNISLRPFDGAAQTLSLQTARTTIDVPDLTDRGSGVVPTSGATILFSRTFNTVPEISVQQTGGSTIALTLVSSLTTTGFFVRLYDAASPTTAVSGSISWSVIGN